VVYIKPGDTQPDKEPASSRESGPEISHLERVALHLERLNLGDYIQLVNNPRRLMYVNFMAGLARGVGMAIGFTLLGAIVVYIIRLLVLHNLPLISDFLADFLQMVISERIQ
jgi:hypothetical protein